MRVRPLLLCVLALILEHLYAFGPSYSIRNSCVSLLATKTASRTTKKTKKTPKKKVTTTTTASKQRGWDYRLAQLQEFHRIHGHALVYDNPSFPGLYQWTRDVRCKRKKYDADALAALNFVWDAREAAWQQQLLALQKFHADNGHCQIPANTKLGVWIHNQRREHRKLMNGENSTLSVERMEALEQIDSEWSKRVRTNWNQRYSELLEFNATNGHTCVPQNTVLGQWCMNQRTLYRLVQTASNTTSALTPARIEKMEELNFPWNLQEHRWKTMLQRLSDYHQLQGHINIAVSDTPNNDLRLWLILQRFHYNTGKMSEVRSTAMEDAIPDFSWRARSSSSPSNKDWAKLFDAMRDKGLKPGMQAKSHWFEGVSPLEHAVKSTWTEQDLLELWNEENDDDDNNNSQTDEGDAAWYN